MAASVKKLGLGDLIRSHRGSFTLAFLTALFGIALKLFFRRIETFNAESVTPDKPVIFVLNHPNGLIDPALVFVAMPRKISFLAKSTLFKMPVISFLLRAVEALPLYGRSTRGPDVSKISNLCIVPRAAGGARRDSAFPEGFRITNQIAAGEDGRGAIALAPFQSTPSTDRSRDRARSLFYTSKILFAAGIASLRGAVPGLSDRLDGCQPPSPR